jgi:hypothetical protein
MPRRTQQHFAVAAMAGNEQLSPAVLLKIPVSGGSKSLCTLQDLLLSSNAPRRAKVSAGQNSPRGAGRRIGKDAIPNC